MKKEVKTALISTLISVLLWLIVFYSDSQYFNGILWVVFGAVVLSVLSVVFWGICLMKKLNSKLSNYIDFAIINLVLMIGLLIYSIYDICTDVGFLRGIKGFLILTYVEPVFLIFEVCAVTAYFIKKKKDKDVEKENNL